MERRVALAYLGDSGNDTWNGYISIITDAFSDNPLSPLFKSMNLEIHWMSPLTVVTTDVVALEISSIFWSINMEGLGSGFHTIS